MLQTLHRQMAVTQGRFARRILADAVEVGLLPGQPKVLEYIYAHDGCTQADICAAWDLDKSTLSGIIGRLERDGLVVRGRDPADLRRDVLRMTPRGRQLWPAMAARLAALERRAWSGIPEADQREFLRILAQIRDNLQMIEGDFTP